jgi:hypothetical protein
MYTILIKYTHKNYNDIHFTVSAFASVFDLFISCICLQRVKTSTRQLSYREEIIRGLI